MLDNNLIKDILHEAISHGGDFAEIFVEHKKSNNINMAEKNIESLNSSITFGIGIRVFNKYGCIYCYGNDTSREALLSMAKKAGLAAKENKINCKINLLNKNINPLHKYEKLSENVAKREKIDLVKLASDNAYNFNDKISMVNVTCYDYKQDVQIANTENLLIEDSRYRTRLMISSVASNGSKKENGFVGTGTHGGFEHYKQDNIINLANEASEDAITMLDADFAPNGKMPVVLNSGFGGVIFHEACGHGLEATSVARNLSVFSNKIGQKVASDLVTYIDDGTIKNGWGSSNIDDEGNKTQKNTLIENGVLKSYMIDKLNSRRMGMKPTGSSRRQSYTLAPTSRMTNTYIDNGKSTANEIISNTEKGLFAKSLSGGQVNPTTGEFNFNVSNAYLIENGKITKPVKGALLIGRGAKIIQKVDMVANDLKHNEGMCGSVSGNIPVGVGQPTLRVSEILVGGRK
jgi:TldD protein